MTAFDAALNAAALSAFGARVRLQAAAGGPLILRSGIFDRFHAEMPLPDGLAVATQRAQLTLDPAGLAWTLGHGDLVELGLSGVGLGATQVDVDAPTATVARFAVLDVQPDAFGMAVLVLADWETQQP